MGELASEVVIDAQPGPQTQAAESDADILLYGGAAGSGKSFFLTMDALKHAHVPGYGAAFFRRTAPELQGSGSLWEEQTRLYPILGGVPTKSPVLQWRFPSNALIQLMHLQHEKDVAQHQSKQYAWIGFDEATHFTEGQFWFLVSRNRSVCGIKPRIRMTCNPDPTSFLRRLIDWYIGKDGYPIAGRSGVKRWFVRQPNGEILWGATKAELEPHAPSPDSVMSFTFIAAKLSDNKALNDKDPSYRTKLEALPPVLRARMLGGNWDISEAAGDMFQDGWFPQLVRGELARVLQGQPKVPDYVASIRFWDLAATPFQGQTVPGIARPKDFKARTEGDPDWTRGLLASRLRNPGYRDKIVLRDLKSWRDTPGAIREGIVRTAQADGPTVAVGLFLDPGQAAIDQIEEYRKALRGIARVVVLEVTKSKLEYAGQPSRMVYQGQIWVDDPDRAWWPAWIHEAEQFPPPKGPGKKPHDDCVDVLSGVVRVIGAAVSWVEDPPEARPERSPDHDFLYGTPDEVEDALGREDGLTRGVRGF